MLNLTQMLQQGLVSERTIQKAVDFDENLILSLRFYEERVLARIQGTEDIYDVHITAYDWTCSCKGWCNHHVKCKGFACKHIIVVMLKLKRLNFQFGGESIMKLATGLPSLDKFTKGGLPLNCLIKVDGLHEVGKTIFVQEMACLYIAQHNKNVLHINTEGGFMEDTWDEWMTQFEKKYAIKNLKQVELLVKGQVKRIPKGKAKEGTITGVNITQFDLSEPLLNKRKIIKPAMIKAYIPNLYILMKLLGRPGVFNDPDQTSGYYRWRDLPDQAATIDEAMLAQLIDQYEIGMFIIDSITNPVKALWSPSPQNMPGRSTCYGHLGAALAELCSVYKTTCLCVSHAVSGGAQPYHGTRQEIGWGGEIVGYTFKYDLYFKKMPKTIRVNKKAIKVPKYNTKRAVFARRWGNKESMKLMDNDKPEYCIVQIGDDGFYEPKGKAPQTYKYEKPNGDGINAKK